MTDNTDDFEVIRGSGNAFRDFGHHDADREQLRAIRAATIIGVLDERGLSVREPHELTGIAAADFSRIRRVNLVRFTIDRLIRILSRLGQEVEISVNVRPRPAHEVMTTAGTHDWRRADRTARTGKHGELASGGQLARP